MKVKQAKAVARQWVVEAAGTIPGFVGAFSHGSINWLSDEAILPPTSDVDIMVILADPNPPVKPGKFIYRQVMLEVSYLPQDQVQSPDQILGNYRLAGSFQTAQILADPAGRLAPLQAAVAGEYARFPWVYARCEDARRNILRHLQSLREADPFHDQVTAWLFGTGVTTHVLLVAGLQNPTVRQRYRAARDLLLEYGYGNFYERLLTLLGCAQMDPARVEQHLAVLAAVFDIAKTVIKTPFPFASDISDQARPIAIDGSRALIERGDHREAIFWIVATYSRCQKVLYHDAPAAVQEQFQPGYRQLLADLGIHSPDDLRQRSEQVKAFLPQLWQVTEAILAANPLISRKS